MASVVGSIDSWLSGYPLYLYGSHRVFSVMAPLWRISADLESDLVCWYNRERCIFVVCVCVVHLHQIILHCCIFWRRSASLVTLCGPNGTAPLWIGHRICANLWPL